MTYEERIARREEAVKTVLENIRAKQADGSFIHSIENAEALIRHLYYMGSTDLVNEKFEISEILFRYMEEDRNGTK